MIATSLIRARASWRGRGPSGPPSEARQERKARPLWLVSEAPAEESPPEQSETEAPENPADEGESDAPAEPESRNPLKLIDFNNKQHLIALGIGALMVILGVVLIILLVAGA